MVCSEAMVYCKVVWRQELAHKTFTVHSVVPMLKLKLTLVLATLS